MCPEQGGAEARDDSVLAGSEWPYPDGNNQRKDWGLKSHCWQSLLLLSHPQDLSLDTSQPESLPEHGRGDWVRLELGLNTGATTLCVTGQVT